MKKLTWIVMLLVYTACTLQAKDRVFKRPPFVAWSSSSIEIDKIVAGDTATTVHIKAYQHPHNGIRIATGSFLRDNNGQIYPIRKGVDITLDKELQMPDSGEAEFQLIFPPIPKDVTTLDFSEGDFDGAYQIWGIQLGKMTSSREALPRKTVWKDKKSPLPVPAFRYGTAVLKGRILNYRKEFMSSFRLHVGGFFLKENPSDGERININPDGTFRTELKVASVTNVYIYHPTAGNLHCFIAPGEETELIINIQELCRRQSRLHQSARPYGEPVYFRGFLAGLQQEWLSDTITLFPFHSIQELKGKTPEEYKKMLFTNLAGKRKEIEKKKCSQALKELFAINLEINTAGNLLNMESNLKIANQQDSTLHIPEGYYDSLQEFTLLYTPKAIYGDNYHQLLSAINHFSDRQSNLLPDSVTAGGILSEQLTVERMFRSISHFTPLGEKERNKLRSFSSGEAYEELLGAANARLLHTIELHKKKSGFTINETGDVVNEQLFASILSKFRGQVLLVDFWATWCNPCRMANKAILPMKEELKDKDITYLYITGETSPNEVWKKMIGDIHGEHFRLKDSQWEYLIEDLGIEGVPTYFIVDREGNITYKQTGFPGVTIMKKQLIKALK